jgi:hypothetical protein
MRKCSGHPGHNDQSLTVKRTGHQRCNGQALAGKCTDHQGRNCRGCSTLWTHNTNSATLTKWVSKHLAI